MNRSLSTRVRATRVSHSPSAWRLSPLVARAAFAVAVLGCWSLPFGARGGAASSQDQLGATDVSGGVDPQSAPVKGRTLELTLSDALSIALDNNLELALSALTEESARYDALGSWGSFDPVFDLGAEYSDGDFPQNNPIIAGGLTVISVDSWGLTSSLTKPLTYGGTLTLGADGQTTSTDNPGSIASEFSDTSIYLTYVQPLMRGFGRDAATADQRALEIQWRITREQRRQQLELTLLSVSNAYWDLVAALEEQAVRELAVALGERQLEQNTERLRVGVGTEVDVLQAETNVATQEQALLSARTSVQSRMDELKQLLFRRDQQGSAAFESYLELWDLPVVPLTPLSDDVEAANAVDWQRSLMRALESRPELNQRRLEIDSAEVRLTQAESERLLGLDFTLDARANGTSPKLRDAVDDTFDVDFPALTAGLALNMPLGNRTRANSERSARVALVSARLRYEQSENQIIADVREAARQLRFSAQDVLAAQKSRVFAERQLSAEETSYREGLSTTFQVLEFQQDLAEALSAEKSAQANLAKASAALEQAEGRLGARVDQRVPTVDEVRGVDAESAEERERDFVETDESSSD